MTSCVKLLTYPCSLAGEYWGPEYFIPQSKQNAHKGFIDSCILRVNGCRIVKSNAKLSTPCHITHSRF